MPSPTRFQPGNSQETHGRMAPDYGKVPDWGASEGHASSWRGPLLRMLNERDPERLARAARALEDALFTRYYELGTALRPENWAVERIEMRHAVKLLRGVLLNKLRYGGTKVPNQAPESRTGAQSKAPDHRPGNQPAAGEKRVSGQFPPEGPVQT